MTYQLRSRGDPVTTESQEQTDISGEHLTEHQVTTLSQIEFILQQLSITQSVAAATAEANRALLHQTYPQNRMWKSIHSWIPKDQLGLTLT